MASSPSHLERFFTKVIGKPAGYGVYVHWPYCTKICSYCNFNKYLQPSTTSPEQNQLMEQCYVKQLKLLLQHAQFPVVSSVYFGGGTPSLAPISTISAILQTINEEVGLIGNAEVTMEVNPSINIINKLSEFKQAGINRVSIGVQSLDDHILKHVLYRDHTAQDAMKVIGIATDIFKGRVNVDIMFNLPCQPVTASIKDTERIITEFSNVNHISLYQLTLERGTAMFNRVSNNEWVLPSDESSSNCYVDLIKLLQRNGFEHYEVSNFSKHGFESVHNLNYWLGGNYVGVGPGAHSCYQYRHGEEWVKQVNLLSPRQWMDNVTAAQGSGMGVISKKCIAPMERFEEILCSSLRTSSGLTKESCDLYSGHVTYADVVSLLECSNSTRELIARGYLVIGDDVIQTTVRGRMVLDSILPHILLELDNGKLGCKR